MDDAKPLFIQLAEQIEGRILDGTYPEETQVPSTNEFAAFLRINPATAGKGLARLVEAGVLYKRRGDRHVRGPGGPRRAPARPPGCWPCSAAAGRCCPSCWASRTPGTPPSTS